MAVGSVKNNGEGPKKRKASPKATATETEGPWAVKDGQKVRSTRALPYEVRLREFFTGLSGVAVLGGDEFVANVIAAKSDELAYGYAKLAQSDPRVKRLLEMVLEGSAWAEAVIPTISLLIVIGWHYGLVPPRLGVPMAMANGLVPVSREQEIEVRRRNEQAARAASTAAPEADTPKAKEKE